MNPVLKNILFIIFYVGATCFSHNALAQETTENGIIDRPVMEYKSGQLRDPFQSYIVKEKKEVVVVPVNKSSALPRPDLSEFKVQGIIWGGRMPQAIINNKVFTVGDSVEGAKIVNIGKNKIILNFDGEVFNLVTPVKKSVNPEVKK
jgi:hypothetical protein